MVISTFLVMLNFQVLLVAVIIPFQITCAKETNYGKITDAFSDLGTKCDKAMAWVLSQKNINSGWVDTVGVVTSLQLANDSNWNIPNTEHELSIKQMSLEIVIALNRNDPNNPLTTGTVAKYSNGILSTCKNPRNYYGHNLISKLTAMKPRYPFETSYQALALCNTGVQISKNVTEKLINIIKDNQDPLFPQDTNAITIMALTCIQKQNGISEDLLNNNVKILSNSQKADGSFGNTDSTSIVVAALLPYLDNDFSWDAIKAVQFLLNQQKEDGSFGNLGTTISVLPVLSGHSLVNLPDLQCKKEEYIRTTDASATRSTRNGIVQDLDVSYSIWIGNDVNEAYTIKLGLPAKSSVYELMQLAAEKDKRFRFTARDTAYGHFITSINDIKNDEKENKYWMYGLLQDEQNREVKMADKGVDDFYPENNDHIVFWYKKSSLQ